MDIVAKLNKQLSRKSINGDLKTLDNTMYVKVIAKLSETLTKKALKQQMKKLTNLELQIGANVKADNGARKKLQDNIKSLQKNLSDIEIGLQFSKSGKIDRNIDSLKKKIQEKPVSINLEFKKQKLISDIEYLGKRYSKIFSNVAAGKKFENILNSAYSVSDQNQLANVRAEFQAFTSEIKAHGLAVQSTADKYKGLISKVKDLFSAATLLKVVFSQIKAAISETIDLDKVYTDLIKVNNELERGDYADYLSKCNQKAKELAATQKGLIEGATEFSKSGFDLSTSNKLSEKSTILANVGEMSDSDAAKAIISGVQAYDVIDGFTDVVDKADALISKYNEIGNTASITTAEIAKGVQSVGSVFADANTSVDEFIALLSAGNRQYQDADALALGLRTAALRIRGCSTELADMGEETDNVYTSASKLAEKIEGLTNINGTGGVKILEDDEETFRSIYDIFLDISKVYKDMSDTDASALLDLIAGKNRASAISATLNNMAEAQEILQNSLHSAGSAQKEYNTYLESTEAHIQRFKATLTETYTSFLDGNMVSHIVDIGTTVLDLNNKTDLLKHSILAIAALNIGKGVSVIGASIASTAKQMNVLGNALQQVKSLPNDDILREKALEKIGESTKNLTEYNLKLLLSQKRLEDSDKIMILNKHNLTDEEAKLKLEKMGLITATKAQSAANVTEATTTTTLKGAMLSLKASIVGVGTSIKAAFLANPIGISLAAITTLASIATSAISKYNQQLEETRQKNIEAATTASQNADKLKELYIEYNRLASIQDKTTSDEEAFKTVIEDITLALGNKIKALENLTAGTDEYAAALKRVTQEEMQSNAVQATIGRKSAEETFQDNIWSNSKGSKIGVNSNSKGKSLSDEAQKAVAIVSDSLKEFETINRTWKNISWDISSNDPEEALAFYNALVEAREKLVLASENDENLLNTEIYSDMNNAINVISENLDTYIEKRYQEEKLNYLAQNSIPETTEEYKAMENALADAAGSSVDLQEKFKELLTADFASLATGIEEVGDAVRILNDTPITFTISDHEESIDNIQSSISTLHSALDSFNQGTLDESAVIDLMQQFPALIPYIDLAADGFGKLSEGLSTLIAQQPESLIQSLEALKESLNTEEERAQVDALINSLQSLSSYGDTGMEAYATSIGSTWSDTANVIQSVTDQFENLAKVQEAVADGLTISTTAAAELANMYPEILTNAEYAGNGQIQLNEEVVKSILAGDQSIINAQITKLEADKAELEARKETAVAELEIANQIGTAKGQIDEAVAKNKIAELEAELEAEIAKNNQAAESYAQAAESMAANTEQLGNYEADVADNMATNMNSASASMADGMAVNSVASQQSLSGIAKKAVDTALAVAGISTGKTISNPNAIYSGKGGTNSGGIKKVSSPSKFTSTVSDYVKGNLNLDEFKSGLEVDIQGYEKAISNIDSQIEVLKNLQGTFADTVNSANGGIGGHGYADKIKDLEKEKDKINSALDDAKSGSGSSKDVKDEYEELFDFFERRVKVLDNALSLLKTNLDNVTGSFAKNKLIDAELGVTEEKFKNYSDALNMYTQKANEALSKLPSDIAAKIKDGAVDLTTFIGEGNEEVVEAVKDYEQWADKIADCKQELAELRTAIRQLELEKFNNIMEEFTNQFGLHEDGKDLVSKQAALLKEAGELLGESFFTTQIDQSKKQLALLEEEKAKLVEQMTSAVSSGRVKLCPLL